MNKRKIEDFHDLEPELKYFKSEQIDRSTGPIMSVKINPPDLKSAKNYECFKNELLLWQSLTLWRRANRQDVLP